MYAWWQVGEAAVIWCWQLYLSVVAQDVGPFLPFMLSQLKGVSHRISSERANRNHLPLCCEINAYISNLLNALL